MGINVFGQNDSVHVNLKANHCNYTWDLEGYESFDSTYLVNNDPMNDTLQLYFEDSILLAEFWLDEYRVWCRLKELNNSEFDRLPWLYIYIYSENTYPYNQWLLFYDFEELDTLNEGDQFTNTTGITRYLSYIDTVTIFGEERKRYVLTESGAFKDHVLEGFGSISNPLAPVIDEGFFGYCNCGIDFEFFDGLDTTAFYYYPDLIIEQDVFVPSCPDPITHSTDEYQMENKLKIYPNPLQGNTLFIETEQQTIIEEINMTNTLGQRFSIDFNQDFNNNKTSLFINDVSDGIYSLEIITDAGRYRKRIVVKK